MTTELRRLEAKLSDPESKARVQKLTAKYYASATSPWNGSGWLTQGQDGNWYCITNDHVAGTAEFVSLKWAEPAPGGFRDMRGRVVYVDPEVDLAVIAVEKGDVPKGAIGFELSERDPTPNDGDAVLAVGFPGTDRLNAEQSYQVTNGIIANRNVKGLISHSASIDHGNSGGPLLVPDRKTSIGYRVVGINTLGMFRGMSSAYWAIPVAYARNAVKGAQLSVKAERSEKLMYELLTKQAEAVAREFGSDMANHTQLSEAVSYALIAAHPRYVIGLTNQFLRNGMTEKQKEYFLQDPVGYAHTYMFLALRQGLTSDRVADIRVAQYLDQDAKIIAKQGRARVVYSVSGVNKEVLFVWERGAWRIRDANFIADTDPPTGSSSAATKSRKGGGESRDAGATARRAGAELAPVSAKPTSAESQQTPYSAKMPEPFDPRTYEVRHSGIVWAFLPAAAGLAVGTFGGVMAVRSTNDARAHCTGNSCQLEGKEDAARAKVYAKVSDWGFGVAAVSTLAGIIALANPTVVPVHANASSQTGRHQLQWRPLVGPRLVGVGAEF